MSLSLLNAGVLIAASLVVASCLWIAHRIARREIKPAGPDRPGWPARRHLLVVALAFSIIAVYGSLVPLRYTHVSLADALDRFRNIPMLQIGIGGRADWVANILLFIPISYFWLAVLTVDQRGVVRAALSLVLVVTAAAAAAVSLEFAQIWFPPRTVSQNDIVAETIGSAAGGLLWLATGQTVVDWIRTYTAAPRRKQQVDWLLEAYFVGLLIYSVLPLDLTISVTELAQKFRAGKVSLVPLADFEPGLQPVYELLRDIVVFVPVGMLVATWRTAVRRPVRPVWMTALAGAAIAAGLEAAQLLVFSRYTTTTDIVLGSAGATIGGWVMFRWRGAPAAAAPPAPAALRFWKWLAAATIYALFLIVLFCMPFETIGDIELLKERYRGFLHTPFARLYRGSEYNAVSEVLRKTLLYAPLGAMLSMAAAALGRRRMRRVVLAVFLLLAAGLSTGIEMLQVFLPPHVPDVTDVILCTAGAAAGMAIVAKALGTVEPDA